MLTLRFDSPSELTLGPSRAFSLEGSFLREHPLEEIVARFAYGAWHVVDKIGKEIATLSFGCPDRSQLRFEDHEGRLSPPYGPFTDLLVQADSFFASGERFAVLQPIARRWQHCATGVRWPILNLLPARV